RKWVSAAPIPPLAPNTAHRLIMVIMALMDLWQRSVDMAQGAVLCCCYKTACARRRDIPC
ncbi:MAG: hypothetical protein ACOVKV_08680, partial [Novosphingobium sp.]